MVVFLTSSPSGALNVPNYNHLLDPSNSFIVNLKKYWKQNMKALIISAAPTSYESNDEMASFFYDCFNNCDLPLVKMDLWDERKEDMNLSEYDLLILGGGHIPTQNKYFHKINLKDKIKDFDGIVVGISAGSMNCATNVYVQPEEENESDSSFPRNLEGLHLTDINIVPHYQMIKEYYLDGKRLFEDIIYKDSMNRKIFVIVDGTYILIENNKNYLYGEAYILKDEKLVKICEKDKRIIIK